MEVARQLAAGTMLDDKYRIERLLAVGGMGAVYVGTHVGLRKRVAIKILNPQLTSEAMVQRFHREAVTASQIGHEGIAQVTDIGTSHGGEAFIVMELLEGEPLSARLKATGPLPVELACELGCAILSPLAAAHAAGIVHRDLKPDNVFLVRQSRGELVKLLDFGISRSQGGPEGDTMRLTNTGVIMGTPFYMAPEQARGDSQISPAADLYSFGVILYELLLGHVPITGENYNQLIYRVMTGEFEPPRVRRPELAPQLEQIILRAMALDVEHRWTSAVELETALLAFCRPTYREHMVERMSGASLPWATPPPGTQPPHRPSRPAEPPQGTDPTLVAPGAITGATPEPSPAKRSRMPVAILATLVVAGGAIAAYALTRRPAAPPPAPVTSVPGPVAVPVPTPAAAQALTPPPPESVKLTFVVEPKDASITVDGAPVPDELAVPRDAARHTLSIRAAGYEPHDETLTFDENQRLVIRLDRIASKPSRLPTHTTKPVRPGRIDSQSPY